MTFSVESRRESIESLKNRDLDVLVIGGGITGAGISLEGTARDLNIGLIEMKDFSSGTSSRSTKLVHGGLRYLKQFDVELVSNITHERKVIGENAPHIVKPEYMVLPVYDEDGASFNDFSSEIALFLYDYLAEVDKNWEHYFISKEESLKDEPALKEEGLLKSGMYLDFRNDDSRLTLEIIKKADQLGAEIANYVEMIDFIEEDEKITGVKAKDLITDEVFDIHAKVVVNATGPWSDETRAHLNDKQEDRMYPTKGVHFVVDNDRLPVNHVIYTDTGLEDDRMIFIIPRGDKTYFGTTDTPVVSPQDFRITDKDIKYLLDAVNRRFPEAHLGVDDLISGWVGLRPLIQDEGKNDPSGLSRGHEVFHSQGGLITIAGGKLTDYRRMSEDTYGEIVKLLEEDVKEVDTKVIPLSGGELPDNQSIEGYVNERVEEGLSLGLSKEEATYLANYYGTNIQKVYQYINQVEDLNLPRAVALQLAYAADYEMVYTVEDFFDRRTEYLLFYPEKIKKWEKPVSDFLGDRFNLSDEEKQKQLDDFNERFDSVTLKKFK